MKYLFTIVIIFSSISMSSQIDYTIEAKRDLNKQYKILQENFEELTIAQDSLRKLTDILSPNVTSFYEEVLEQKNIVDSIYKNAETAISFYLTKAVKQEVVDSVITLPENYLIGVNQIEEEEEETYLLFGKNKIISKQKILKDETASKVFNTIINEESETYFGDFWFPKDKEEIFVVKKCEDKDSIYTALPKYRSLYFDKMLLDMYEGNLRDIKVFLKDDMGKTHIFENTLSISLLNFNDLSERNFLKNTAEKTSVDNTDYSCYRLKVVDVLRYITGEEGNFVPNDASFSFPLFDDEGNKTNIKASNRYQLRQSTSLNNVIDLRAYTDLLGLSGETPNGIAQFEGQADFFILPFGTFSDQPNLYAFKKIKPYVQFARLDEENEFLQTKIVNDTLTLVEPLNHIQQSFLDTGVRLDLISYNPGKNFPFEIVLNSVVRYQLSKVRVDSESYTYKTLGAGAGLAFEFKRLKNFKLNILSELANYHQAPYNNIPEFNDPESFLVFRNEFEVSYFPSNKQSSAIFLRMRVYDNQDAEEGANFFQFQFGYKFTIGAGKIKTQ